MLMINKAAITRKVAQRSISEIPVLKVYVLSTHYAKVAVIKTRRSCVSVCSVIIICKVAAITLNRQHLQQMIKTTGATYLTGILQRRLGRVTDHWQCSNKGFQFQVQGSFFINIMKVLVRICILHLHFTIDKMDQKDWSSFLWSKITQSEADG